MSYSRTKRQVTVVLDQDVFKKSGLQPVSDSVNSNNQGLFEVSEAPVKEIEQTSVEVKHNKTRVIITPSRDGKSLVITVVKRSTGSVIDQKVCELLV